MGLYGDLIVIDEKGVATGIQKVKRYWQSKAIPPLQLLVVRKEFIFRCCISSEK
jgi:hypothetical protein